MIFIYLLLVLLGAFPLVLTTKRMLRHFHIKKAGIRVNGSITHIRTMKIKYTQVDLISIEYKDQTTGNIYQAKASSKRGKYRYSDHVPIMYLPGNPARYTLLTTKSDYTIMLIFSIILFLFVLFAIYNIDKMVVTGRPQ